MPLFITIIGAGISGLTAALALRQKGHYVTILEKSSFLQEAGAAISMGPNCTGILDRLGMKGFTVGANLLEGMAQYTTSGETKQKIDITAVAKQWQNPWYLIHRGDLHRELKRLVLDPEGPGVLAELHLGCLISSIDAEKGIVRLEDGRIFQAHVIIGADGNFSIARKEVDPDAKPYAWGKSCYRWLVPRKELLADSVTKELVGPDGWLAEVTGADRRIIMYPCRDNMAMNFVAFIPNEEANASDGDWNQKGNRSTLLKGFEESDPAVRKLLSYMPEDVRMWKLYDMETMQKWTNGRLALIGDAAHPFLPFLGQGGASAIESAASIAQVLPEGTPAFEVPQRLKLYERIRHERVSVIQEQTRINGLDEDKRPPVKGGFTLLGYCYNHDEWENSAAKLEEWRNGQVKVNGH